MVQILKDDILENIKKAALHVFAKKGYIQTRMNDIAKQANISVGNIYRYFKNKDALFYEVVPDSLVALMSESLKTKMSQINGIHPESLYKKEIIGLFDEYIMPLILSHKNETIILIQGNVGTKYEGFEYTFAKHLSSILSNYSKSVQYDTSKDENREVVIEMVYVNFLKSLAKIVQACESYEEITKQIHYLVSYHMFGILEIL